MQLLGDDPGRMAASAARAHELGATAVDINFGCPAPTVNRRDGTAEALGKIGPAAKEDAVPELLRLEKVERDDEVRAAVRQALARLEP